MGSTFFSLHFHIVFSTKERLPLIQTEWRARLHSYLGGIIRGTNGVPEIVGGVSDHIHIVASLRPVHTLADLMRDLKKDSTNWIKDNFDRRFAWQEGYAAFTVSPSATGAVRRYIANQELHHRKDSFVEELRQLLGKAGIEYEEKYLLWLSGTSNEVRAKYSISPEVFASLRPPATFAQPSGLSKLIAHHSGFHSMCLYAPKSSMISNPNRS